MPDTLPDSVMLGTAYRLIAELLLHPDDRDTSLIAESRALLARAPAELREPLAAFLDDAIGASTEEYVSTLELAPLCPLYLGAYLFEQPSTCRTIGMSERNRYMLELQAIYRHFGFELEGRELADFLPIVVEFLWLSLAYGDRDAIGLRRWLVEHYIQPALAPLSDALARTATPYMHLVTALTVALASDCASMAETKAWSPPERRSVAAPQLTTLTRGRAPARPAAGSTP